MIIINSSGMNKSAIEIPHAHQYHSNFHGAVPGSKKNTFYVINTQVPFSFTDSTSRCKALHVILNQSDVESVFLGPETAPWKF